VAPAAASSYYHRTAVHILVVEDEEKVARALQEGLEAEGYKVTLAPTGEDGFFRASAENFDLVILALLLPGRDGLQILAAMRQRVSRRRSWC
jgi:DNA-binding response OmpR family regulator